MSKKRSPQLSPVQPDKEGKIPGWRARRKSKIQLELESTIFDLEQALTQSQLFEKIVTDKLTYWVNKHDELLIAYKELKSKYEPIDTPQIAQKEDAGGN